MNSKVKGYLIGSVAAATYGLNPLFALPLYADGMAPDSVLFFRYLISVPVIAMMIIIRGRSFRVPRKQIVTLATMGSLLAISSLALFESYNYMDAGIASTLLFVYPVMVAVLMAIFFGERLNVSTIGCILLSCIGIGLLFKAPDGATLSLTGTLIVMVSSLSYAIYIVGIDRPGLKRVPTLTVIFWALVTGSILFGAKLSVSGTVCVPSRWYLWGCIIALSIFPTVISFLCTTIAIQKIGPTPTAILGALEPVTAVVVGIFVFDERVSLQDWCGITLIVCAVTGVVAGSRITPVLIRFRKLFPRIRRPG